MAYRFTLGDGTVIDVPEGSQGLADEVAWEREFKMSSAVLSIHGRRLTAFGVVAAAAKAAGQPEPEVDPDMYLRTEWLVFFAYRALKRQDPKAVPATFEAFMEKAAAEDWEFEIVEEAVDDAELDDETAGEILGEGGSLDPTAQEAPPISLPDSSSLVSPGATSS